MDEIFYAMFGETFIDVYLSIFKQSIVRTGGELLEMEFSVVEYQNS